MFLTITIDTKNKKTQSVRFNKKRMNAAAGWRKMIHMKKRGVLMKFRQWKKGLSRPTYRLGEQKVMF